MYSDIYHYKDKIPLSSSLFTKIGYSAILDYATYEQMDIMLYSEIANRPVAPIVLDVQLDRTIPLTSDDLNRLGALILARYKFSWDKMLTAAELEYDPIHNFADNIQEAKNTRFAGDTTLSRQKSENRVNTKDLTDTKTSNVTKNSSENQSISDSKSYTNTKNLTDTSTDSGQESTAQIANNSYYGFNSVTAVPADEISGSTTISGGLVNTLTHTGTDSISATDMGTQQNTVSGTEATMTTDAHTGTDTIATMATNSDHTVDASTNEVIRTVSRTGNIGNISTQKLIKEELELWGWNLVKRIILDVKEFVTIPVYD